MTPALRLFVSTVFALPMAAMASGGPERGALLSATWLGQVGEEEGAKVAVSWKGDAPVWIEVFEDTDGDGQLGKGEWVVLERAVEKGMEVVHVVEGSTGALGLRWQGDGAEGMVALRPAEPSAFTADCGTFPGAQFPAGTGPISVAIGDLDGDGNADLAVANAVSSNVSIMLGNGSGTFAAAVDYGADGTPFSIAIGDLDGDGHADLAVANQSWNAVSILLGSGSGTFAAAVHYGVGSLPQSVAIGDLDGDGHADLAVANAISNNVSILLGNGSGTFAAAVNYGVGSIPRSVAIGDLDGDGHADLAVANQASDNVSILLGSGSGTFAAAVNYAVGSGPYSVAIGDLDGAGDVDLAVANFSSNNVSTLLGSGSGTFAPAVNYAVGSGPVSIAIGDLDGDGNADLAVANFSSNNVSTLLGSGSGTFAAAVDYAVGSSPRSVAIGDLDGDGDADLAVANQGSDNVSILLNQCTTPADTTAPSDPTIATTVPLASTWSIDNTIEVTFSGAADNPGGSGLDGYSVLFDQVPTTSPDSTVDLPHTTDPHVATSDPLADGDSWYAHISTCDIAENCTSTVHAGPFWIDTTAPSAPGTVSSSSHSATPVADTTIDTSWVAASDSLSGVASYRYDFTTSATPPACGTLAQTTASTTTSSAALADGSWYAHVCAVDQAGNMGVVTTGGPFLIDAAAPTGLLLSSPSHTTSTWDNDATVDVTLSGATHENGVTGYSITFDQNATTDPGTTPTQAGTSYVGTATSDGNSWYTHARACDQAGNCGTVVHLGPFWIDTTAPSTPTGVDSTSHTVGTPSADATIDTEWVASGDATSGIAGYAWAFLGSDSWICDGVIDGTDLSTSSAALSTGQHWFHVCSVDGAGNQSAVSSIGPFELDLVAPSIVGFDTVADTGDGALSPDEITAASITQILAGFDETLDQATAETLANWILVEAGSDGTIDSAVCLVDPNDIDASPAAASLLADEQTVRLDVGGGLALPGGRYRLSACSGITDVLGNNIADAAVDFVVTSTNLIQNPNFDDTIVPWVPGGTRPQDLGWSSIDAEGKATSGSLAVTAVGATEEDTTATACFDIVPGTPFVLGGAIEVTGGNGGDPLVTLQLMGSSVVDCQSPAAPLGNLIASGPTAGWLPFAVALPGSYSSVEVVMRVAAETSPSHSVRLDLLGVDGPIFQDGFESGDTSVWSNEMP